MPMLRPAALALLLALLAGCGAGSMPPEEALQAQEPRLLLPPPGADNAAGYMTLRNRGDAELRIEALSSPAYGRVELHTMTRDEDGMMRMRRLEGLSIAPGESVALEPHGRHLMLMAPEAAPQAGEAVPVTLRYRVGDARHELELELPAEKR